jgi:MinD-like ATPase involved in chromosome partitioning or flagellar assembly
VTERRSRIITFYSYKGGTGRSMTLANVAWILASNGKRVLAVDWDLEAPGLHRYFGPFLLDRDLKASAGLIELVTAYADDVVKSTASPSDAPAATPRTGLADVARYVLSVDWVFQNGGKIDLLPAGMQGPLYATRINSFDWGNFYNRLGGWQFIDSVRQAMLRDYDYVLIDSRTGISDTAGICTMQMPDALVVAFTLNTQSMLGAAAVATSVREQRRDPTFRIFPVPMRVENAEKQQLEIARDEYRDRFALFVEHLSGDEQEQYWGGVEVPYLPFYAYGEILATFGDRPQQQTTTLLKPCEKLTSYLSDREVAQFKPTVEQERRAEMLRPRSFTFFFGDVEPVKPSGVLEAAQQTFEQFERATSTSAKLLDEETVAALREKPEALASFLADRTRRRFWEASVAAVDRRRKWRSTKRWLGAAVILAAAPVAYLIIGHASPLIRNLTLAAAAGAGGSAVVAYHAAGGNIRTLATGATVLYGGVVLGERARIDWITYAAAALGYLGDCAGLFLAGAWIATVVLLIRTVYSPKTS